MANALYGFYLANPQDDWKNRRDIYWGTASSYDRRIIERVEKQVLADIIAYNYQSKEPFVYTLGPVRTESLARSYVQIFQSTFSAMAKSQWINTAKILAYVVVSGGLFAAAAYFGVKFLHKQYDQMSRGLLGIYPKDATAFEIKYMLPIRMYDKWDFGGDCFMIGGGLFALSFVSIPGFTYLPEDSFFSAYTREKQPYRIVQELRKRPSSMSGFDLKELANEKDGEKWIDPILYTEIPDILSPRIFRIGKHAYDIGGFFKTIFAKPLDDNNRIWHPFFNGYMDDAVQQKFLHDISAFFCISEKQFLDCWKHEITVNQVPGNIDLSKLFFLARTVKFLQLIPNQIIHDKLAEILLRDQKVIAAQLCDNSLSLTYVEIFGHPSFSIERFLKIES